MYQGTLNQGEYMRGPQPVGLCFAADGRTAKFLVDKSYAGERLLDLLTKHPNAPSRLARPYGLTGWVVEE